MKGRWAAACMLALGMIACDRDERERAQVNIAAAPLPAAEPERQDPAPEADCAPHRAGEYRTIGNRWGRSGHICIDHVELRFEAFPDPSLNYSVVSDRCPDLGHFGRFRSSRNFFETPVPEQMEILKSAIADDLRAFARQCGIRLDPAPFVDQRFDRFYIGYGDGWWFDRLNGEFRLTPDATAGGGETAAGS